MFFLTGIIIVLLFLISTSVPILGWVLPYYKIKKLRNRNLNTKVLANITAIIILAIIDVKFLITYFGIFLLIEILYYIFENYANKTDIFDRIFIIGLIVSTLVSIYIYSNMDKLNMIFEELQSLYLKKTQFSKADIDFAFGYMRQNFTFLIFLYINLTVFLTYYFLDRVNFVKWKISYIWLLPYFLFFFLEKYSKFSSTFISEGTNIFKIIYVFYFIKVVTSLMSKKTNKQTIGFIIGILLVLISPIMSFIIGGLASLMKIENKKIK